MQLEDLRNDYKSEPLVREKMFANPYDQFQYWFDQALKAKIAEPNAMGLSTVDDHGQPSSRMVLLKYVDTEGFVFFTNLKSRKVKEMEQNPKVALIFPWITLHRQVRICGMVKPVSKLKASAYFATRPRGSQLGAWVSHQSEVISTKALLMEKYKALKTRFKNKEVDMPGFWGGFKVYPHKFEFWQGQKNRLHDRFEYTRSSGDFWEINRLQP